MEYNDTLLDDNMTSKQLIEEYNTKWIGIGKTNAEFCRTYMINKKNFSRYIRGLKKSSKCDIAIQNFLTNNPNTNKPNTNKPNTNKPNTNLLETANELKRILNNIDKSENNKESIDIVQVKDLLNRLLLDIDNGPITILQAKKIVKGKTKLKRILFIDGDQTLYVLPEIIKKCKSRNNDDIHIFLVARLGTNILKTLWEPSYISLIYTGTEFKDAADHLISMLMARLHDILSIDVNFAISTLDKQFVPEPRYFLLNEGRECEWAMSIIDCIKFLLPDLSGNYFTDPTAYINPK